MHFGHIRLRSQEYEKPTLGHCLVLLKFPLLLTLAVGSYQGMTRPTRPPRPDEMKRAVPDFLASMTKLQEAFLGSAKIIFCTLALSEAATLVVTQMLPLESPIGAVTSSLPLFRLGQSASSLSLTTTSALGCILGASGGFIRLWCHRTLGRFFTWNVALLDDHKLVTAGPYSIVRHPSYTGWFLLTCGNLMLLFSRGSFFMESGMSQTIIGKMIATCAVLSTSWFCLGAFRRTASEDMMLKKQFGTQWEHWARKTRYRLIPFVY